MAFPHPALIDIAAGRSPAPPAESEADALLASALEHRMTGLLWSAISAEDVRLPREHVRALAREDLAVQARHRRLWALASTVQERLARLGVDSAVMKGIAAERRWYNRIGERPCNDLDLLLEPGAEQRMEEVIDALEPDHFFRDAAPGLVASGVLQSLDLTVDGAEVDVHTDLLKIEIPTRQAWRFWERTTRVAGPDGVELRALDPEVQLVHFLLHLNKDRFAQLLGFADIARILSHEELDWQAIDSLLGGEGLRVHGYNALDVVSQVLDIAPAPLPRLRGPRAAVWRSAWPVSKALQGRLGLARHHRRQLLIPWLARRRVTGAMRWWLRRRVFPPRELVPVYYPDTDGPYFWRLVSGRIRRQGERRQLIKRLDAQTLK